MISHSIRYIEVINKIQILAERLGYGRVEGGSITFLWGGGGRLWLKYQFLILKQISYILICSILKTIPLWGKKS